MEDRIAGCIYGQFIGDAFGTRYEFSNAATAKSKLTFDINKQIQIPILGGGPFDLLAGQVTDDTEMACALADSLIQNQTYNQSATALNYIQWANSSPFDMGRTTRTALQGNDSAEKVLSSVKLFNSASLSNGCLMRVSPLAVFATTHPELDLENACYSDCLLTHCHPVALDAVYVYCKSIQAALRGKGPKEIYQTAYDSASTGLIKSILGASVSKAEPVLLENGSTTVTDDKMGYLGIALQNSFYELLHAKSFEAGLINIVSRGGDTDTNGAIAGALLGAYYGKQKIPDYWVEAVQMKNPRTEKYPLLDQININGLLSKLK